MAMRHRHPRRAWSTALFEAVARLDMLLHGSFDQADQLTSEPPHAW
jgi:hypothetical protein